MGSLGHYSESYPELRFPKFSGEWQEDKLGTFLTIKHGKSQHGVEISEGGFPILASGGEIGRAGKPLYSKPSVLIGRKGTIDKPRYMDIPFWTVDTLFYSELKSDNIAKFFYYYFNRINWRAHNEGSGVPSLSASTISNIKLKVPQADEQQKIADFLTAFEERITAIDKKVDLLKKYKKGVMQKIFTQQVRFSDENSSPYPDWSEKKLDEVFDRITYKNKENNQNVLTISAQQGLISQTDYFNKVVAAKNVTNYYLLQRNDFAYNKSYSTGYPMGAIKRLKYYDKGIVSTLYICFRSKDERDVNFFEHVFDLGLQNPEIEKIAQEGARNHGLLNIAVGEFFDIELLSPVSKEERVKIADFLTSIDKKIKAEETKLAAAKRFKKALLQRMFV